jgi:hypothetical protein
MCSFGCFCYTVVFIVAIRSCPRRHPLRQLSRFHKVWHITENALEPIPIQPFHMLAIKAVLDELAGSRGGWTRASHVSSVMQHCVAFMCCVSLRCRSLDYRSLLLRSD